MFKMNPQIAELGLEASDYVLEINGTFKPVEEMQIITIDVV